jgi:hypothetical protein
MAVDAHVPASPEDNGDDGSNAELLLPEVEEGARGGDGLARAGDTGDWRRMAAGGVARGIGESGHALRLVRGS